MTAPTVTLSGAALRGVRPDLLPPDVSASLAERASVRLGRRRPAARPQAPRLSAYFDQDQMARQPPEAVDYYTRAMPSIARMYLNDRYGDCVIAGKAHALGVWSGNDSDSAGVVLASDDEILRQYEAVCGPGDQGCYIGAVLDYCRDRGFQAGGRAYRIDGYVQCDWTNKLEVEVALDLFGCLTIGINLPEDWTRSDVWDVTNSRVVGGHDVTCCGYDPKGVYVASWGRLYQITWAAFTRRNWLEECYAMLAPLWYGTDRMAPSGVDALTLKADLEKLGRGEIPPLPEPAPQPPPPGPEPGPTPPPGPAPGDVVAQIDRLFEQLEARFPPGGLLWRAAHAAHQAVDLYFSLNPPPPGITIQNAIDMALDWAIAHTRRLDAKLLLRLAKVLVDEFLSHALPARASLLLV